MSAYNCSTTAEMLQLYFQCNMYGSLTHVASGSSGMPIKIPFPMDLFDERVRTKNGLFEDFPGMFFFSISHKYNLIYNFVIYSYQLPLHQPPQCPKCQSWRPFRRPAILPTQSRHCIVRRLVLKSRKSLGLSRLVWRRMTMPRRSNDCWNFPTIMTMRLNCKFVKLWTNFVIIFYYKSIRINKCTKNLLFCKKCLVFMLFINICVLFDLWHIVLKDIRPFIGFVYWFIIILRMCFILIRIWSINRLIVWFGINTTLFQPI